MKIKIYYVITAILIGLTIVSYKFFKKEKLKDDSILTIGTASGYAPWVSINEQGEYEGFDIEVINEIANKLNKKLIIKDLGSMSSLLMALEQNKIDAIIWGMSITQDRLKKINMVRYQGDTVKSYPLLFWKKIPENIKSINDMKNMTICVEPTSSQDTVLNKYDFINKLPTEKIDDALLNIQYAKADAALVEPAIAKKFKKKYPEIQILDVELDPANQVHGVGICIKLNNTELADKIKSVTDLLIKDGTINKLEAKWDIA